MRSRLGQFNRQRLRLMAVVGRAGQRPGLTARDRQMLVLLQVRQVESGEVLTDHLWTRRGRWARGLTGGELIELTAKVSEYRKGKHSEGRETDYELRDIRKVKVIHRDYHGPAE